MTKEEMSFNPCFFWNLKDGCITSGIWTMIYSIIQLCIFSWQSYVIKWERDKTANRRLPFYGTYESYDYRYLGPDWTKFYVAPEERFFTGLFVVQILCLISAFFLLFGSVALIYGVHTSSKHLIWPWFPCVTTSILCSLAYCVTWWTWGVENYWLILTVIESLSVLVNLYVLLCVIIHYRQVLQQHEDYTEDQKVPVVVWDDYNQKENFRSTRLGPEAYWNKTFEDEPKRGSNKPISAQGQGDIRTFPSGEAQKDERLWAQDAALMKHARYVVGESQAEKRTKSQSEQQLDEAMDSMETIRMETVLDGPMEVLDADKRKAFPSAAKRTDGTERSRSVDALAAKPAEKPRRSMRSSRSRDSVCTRHRHRSHSHHRPDSDGDVDERRSLGDSRSGISDTDTGYSESSRHSRHKHRHRDGEKDELYKHGKHRRVRDVKREDKERSDKKSSATSTPSPTQPYMGVSNVPAFGIPVYPSNYSVAYNPAFAGSCDLPSIRGDPYFGTTHMFPGYPVAQAFAPGIYPQTQRPVVSALREAQPPGSFLYTDLGNVQQQQFVIPTSQQQPQKFHINSEIQISYSDHAQSRPDSQQSVQQNSSVRRTTPPNVGCSAAPLAVVESEVTKVAPSTSECPDSRGTGATAV